MKPELKRKSDQRALWRAIRLGAVDIIESDHAPHTIDEKEAEPPAYGVPGLETTLPLMMQAVKDGRLPLQTSLRHGLAQCAAHLAHHAAAQDLNTLVDTDVSYRD